MRIIQALSFYALFHLVIILVSCDPPDPVFEGYDILGYAVDLPKKDIINRSQVTLRLYPDSLSNPYIGIGSSNNASTFSTMADPAVYNEPNQFISNIEIKTLLPLGDSISAGLDITKYFLVNHPIKFLHEEIDLYLNLELETRLNLVSTVDFPGDSIHLNVEILMTDGNQFTASTLRKALR